MAFATGEPAVSPVSMSESKLTGYRLSVRLYCSFAVRMKLFSAASVINLSRLVSYQ